jgi:hypothetical protein
MCASIHDALRCKDQDWKVLGPTAIACALFQATAIVTRGNTTGTEDASVRLRPAECWWVVSGQVFGCAL